MYVLRGGGTGECASKCQVRDVQRLQQLSQPDSFRPIRVWRPIIDQRLDLREFMSACSSNAVESALQAFARGTAVTGVCVQPKALPRTQKSSPEACALGRLRICRQCSTLSAGERFDESDKPFQ
jgi:hypothetical protein